MVGLGKSQSREGGPPELADMCRREEKSTEAGWTPHWDRSLRGGIQRRTLAGTSERGRKARGGWKVAAERGDWMLRDRPQNLERRFSKV